MRVYLAERNCDGDTVFIETPKFDAEIEYWSQTERWTKKWEIVHKAELNGVGDPILVTEKRMVYPDGWFETGTDHTEEEEYYLKRVIQVPRYYLTFTDIDKFVKFMLEYGDSLEVTERSDDSIILVLVSG